MNDESGFFAPDKVDVPLSAVDSFHDFRLIYTSTRGFTRIFTAKRNGKIFVVKFLRPEFRNDSSANASLRKEYDCGYAVDSPFAVRTYDFITLDEYGPAIILEYCPGKTLSDYIEERIPLSAADVDAIVSGAVSGLKDIHSHGIIHRDIKPANIIYSPSARALKIIDFGCADSDNFYLLHEAAGTERYTPETVLIDNASADAGSDFYALGMTLSQLSAIMPESRSRIVERLSSLLISRKITTPDRILSAYQRMIGRRKPWIWVIVILLLALQIGSIVFFIATRQYGTDAERTFGADTISVSVADSTHAASERVASNPTVKAAVVPEPSENTPKRDAAAKSTDGTKVEPPGAIAISGNENTPNEYGVTFAEAKYMAMFSESEVDSYVIQRTDNALRECNAACRDTSKPDSVRREAYNDFYSFTAISSRVMREVKSKYPDADRRRTLGLVKQRMRLWKETKLAPPPAD